MQPVIDILQSIAIVLLGLSVRRLIDGMKRR